MSPKWSPLKYLKKALKIVGWTSLSVIALFILLALTIQIPFVQNKLIQKGVTFLTSKIGTAVSLEHISLAFPKKIVLTGLYLEDQSKDTLLYTGKLSINTDLWGLLHHRIQLDDIQFDTLNATITRSSEDSTFNFDYIINAFEADSTMTPDTTSTPWSISFGTLKIIEARLAYNDGIQGNEISLDVKNLEVNTDEFDLKRARIKINTFSLENAKINVVQSAIIKNHSPSSAPENKTSPFELGVDEISLREIVADYKHVDNGQIIHLSLGELFLEAGNFNLEKQEIGLEKVLLANTFISYQQLLSDDGTLTTSETADSISVENSWGISLENLEFKNNNFQYHNFNSPVKRGQIDFNHLWITRLNTSAEHLRFDGSNLEAKINNLSLLDRSGFGITSFESSFLLSDTSLVLKELDLQTPQSRIILQAQAQFASFHSLAQHYEDARIKLNIDQSVVSMKDVLYFNPQLLDSIPLSISNASTVKIDASAAGPIKNLRLDHLTIRAFSDTYLRAAGSITGLPHRDGIMQVKLDTLYTTKVDLKSILPDTLLPSALELPQWIGLSGNFDGSFDSPSIKAWIKSDIGMIDLDASLNLRENNKTDYKGDVNIKALQLGKLLKQQETIGELNMKASVEGTGLTMADLNAYVDINVLEFQYKEYSYRDFKLNGSLKGYFFSGKAVMEDENLNFILQGDLNFNKDVREYDFTFALKNADFNALHLSAGPLKARGTLDLKLATADFKSVNGNLDIRDVGIYNGDELYLVDSLLFASIDQEGQSNISIRSDILTADFDGSINLFSMSTAIRRHFNKYFSTHDTIYSELTAPQNFTFNLELKNTDLLTKIILPELEPFVPGKIEGAFDSESSKLDLRLNLTKIRYAGVGVDSLSFNVTSDETSLDYIFAIRKISYDTLRIEAMKLTGKVSHDSIRTKFVILDSLQKDKYVLGGTVQSQEKTLQFHLSPEEVIINYAPWEMPADNLIYFKGNGIVARNFSATNINEKVSLVTQQNSDSTTSFVFKDLNLQNITNLIEGTILADGLINGDFNVAGRGAFHSNLKILDLEIFKQSLGDLSLELERTATGPYTASLNIEGEHIDLLAAGSFSTQEGSNEIDLTTTLSKLNLEIIEPFTGGRLKNTKGQLAGEVKIIGNATKPMITGGLHFKDATFTPAFANSTFILQNETISFMEDGILLKDFIIRDEQNNTASIKGSIKTSGYTHFDLDLSLSAKNFQLLNTTEDDNDLFYGKVGMNTTTKITGTLDHPKIQMQVNLVDESELTYVVPQSEKGVLEQKGVVVFVDKDVKNDPFLANIDPRDTIKSTFKGIELTANIELNENETFSIVIDPITGDKLSVQGNSTLTLDIDPTGDILLSGRYEITEGTYDLTFYKLVKRNFKIEKGSTIIWAGNPLDASMDIKASFQVETSPMELVSNQLTASSTQELNMYRQRLPFLVYLNIEGNLLTPEISFELDMPIDKRNAFAGTVYAKIKDINTRESDLNKQVFALLILRRFISENIFDNQGGSDVASTARRSVSKLLTEQLNRLSENIKGIELSFDVKSYEDYSEGQAQGQTEVQLGVSKSLLDDRLIVKVAGNVDIEGNTSSQNSLTDYIGDLALEYSLTEDGRFRITGFRKSNYDIISGELIETGAGLIYIKDYNTLRELFKSNAKDK